MLMRLFILSVCLLPINSLWAITCYYTLAKDDCWLKYDVTVEVMDAVTTKILTTVTVPAGTSWSRQAFTCQAGEKLMYKARFTPIIWESERDKSYSARNYWSLPSKINAGDSAWNVSACFSADFSEVPLPPEAKSHCQCDFTSIPSIKPQ